MVVPLFLWFPSSGMLPNLEPEWYLLTRPASVCQSLCCSRAVSLGVFTFFDLPSINQVAQPPFGRFHSRTPAAFLHQFRHYILLLCYSFTHVYILLLHYSFTIPSLFLHSPFTIPSLFLHSSFTIPHYSFTHSSLILHSFLHSSFTIPSLILHSSFTHSFTHSFTIYHIPFLLPFLHSPSTHPSLILHSLTHHSFLHCLDHLSVHFCVQRHTTHACSRTNASTRAP